MGIPNSHFRALVFARLMLCVTSPALFILKFAAGWRACSPDGLLCSSTQSQHVGKSLEPPAALAWCLLGRGMCRVVALKAGRKGIGLFTGLQRLGVPRGLRPLLQPLQAQQSRRSSLTDPGSAASLWVRGFVFLPALHPNYVIFVWREMWDSSSANNNLLSGL